VAWAFSRTGSLLWIQNWQAIPLRRAKSSSSYSSADTMPKLNAAGLRLLATLRTIQMVFPNQLAHIIGFFAASESLARRIAVGSLKLACAYASTR
jgi:hypothetical protein